MNSTSGIGKLCFVLLFTAVYSAPLLPHLCTTANNLEPQRLLHSVIKHHGLNSQILALMDQALNIEGIPRLDDMKLIAKTEQPKEFYKAFKVLSFYFRTLLMDILQNEKSELKFIEFQMETITNSLSDLLGTPLPTVSNPAINLESDFDKKQFSYKIVKLYMKWLDAMKNHACP